MIHEFTFLDRKKYKGTTTHYRRQFVLEYWEKKDPLYKDGPSEENFVDLLTRAEKMFEEIEKREENKIAVFSHGQFITALKLLKRLPKNVSAMSHEDFRELMPVFRKLNREIPIGNTEMFTLEELAN
jgi:probable phosphoglycerate mutase